MSQLKRYKLAKNSERPLLYIKYTYFCRQIQIHFMQVCAGDRFYAFVRRIRNTTNERVKKGTIWIADCKNVDATAGWCWFYIECALFLWSAHFLHIHFAKISIIHMFLSVKSLNSSTNCNQSNQRNQNVIKPKKNHSSSQRCQFKWYFVLSR